jgi:hypothetical protein
LSNNKELKLKQRLIIRETLEQGRKRKRRSTSICILVNIHLYFYSILTIVHWLLVAIVVVSKAIIEPTISSIEVDQELVLNLLIAEPALRTASFRYWNVLFHSQLHTTIGTSVLFKKDSQVCLLPSLLIISNFYRSPAMSVT